MLAECKGDWNPDAFGVKGLDDDACAGAGASGDGVCLTNIDFVPSTKRPPRGGPAWMDGAKVVDCAEKGGTCDDGPAPGDCGRRGLCAPLADEKPEIGSLGVSGTDAGGAGDCGRGIPAGVRGPDGPNEGVGIG